MPQIDDANEWWTIYRPTHRTHPPYDPVTLFFHAQKIDSSISIKKKYIYIRNLWGFRRLTNWKMISNQGKWKGGNYNIVFFFLLNNNKKKITKLFKFSNRLAIRIDILLVRTLDGHRDRVEVEVAVKSLRLDMWRWQHRMTFSGAKFPNSAPELNIKAK